MKAAGLRESLSLIKQQSHRKFYSRAKAVAGKVRELRKTVDAEGMLMERLGEGVEALGTRLGLCLEEEIARKEGEWREKRCAEREKLREMDEAMEETVQACQETKAKFDISTFPLETSITDLKTAQSALREQFSASISALKDELAQITTSTYSEASLLAFSLPLPDPKPKLRALDSAVTAKAEELVRTLSQAAKTLNLSI